jgi:hypothetical protein
MNSCSGGLACSRRCDLRSLNSWRCRRSSTISGVPRTASRTIRQDEDLAAACGGVPLRRSRGDACPLAVHRARRRRGRRPPQANSGVSSDPLVAGLPSDPRRDRTARWSKASVGDELRSLVHSQGLTPWHEAPPAVPQSSTCYLCPRTKLLPMCLDRTPVQPNLRFEPTTATVPLAVPSSLRSSAATQARR